MPLVLVLVVDEHAVPLGLLGRGDEMAGLSTPGSRGLLGGPRSANGDVEHPRRLSAKAGRVAWCATVRL
jgi:hypothetical protein